MWPASHTGVVPSQLRKFSGSNAYLGEKATQAYNHLLCNNNYYIDVYDALCFCSSVVLHAVSLQEMNKHLYTHVIVWLYEYILFYVMDTRVIVMGCGLCDFDNISMHKYYIHVKPVYVFYFYLRIQFMG